MLAPVLARPWRVIQTRIHYASFAGVTKTESDQQLPLIKVSFQCRGDTAETLIIEDSGEPGIARLHGFVGIPGHAPVSLLPPLSSPLAVVVDSVSSPAQWENEVIPRVTGSCMWTIL